MTSNHPDRTAGARLPKVRLGTFYGGYFLVVGVLSPFWPLYLEARGVGPSEIGLMFALTFWLRALVGPPIGRYADRLGDSRLLLIGLGLLALAASIAFFWTRGFLPLLTANTVFFLAYSSLLPLVETVALRTVDAEKGYGRVRVWGSISFMIAAAGGGFALEAYGALDATTIVWLVVITTVFMVLGILWLPSAPPRAEALPPRAPLMSLLKNRVFLLFIAATTLIHASHGVFYGFSTLHWTAAGHDKATIGLLWAEGVLVEVLLFAFGAKFVQRVGPVRLIVLGSTAAVVRWVVMGLTTDLVPLALVQVLHAGSFAAVHLGAMLFISRGIADSHANSAQAAFSGIAYGAGIGFGLLIAGWLYDVMGGGAYMVQAIMAAGGIIFAVALGRVWQGQVLMAADVGAAAR